MKISGKIIWVTGASRGLGESIARLLAQRGAKVGLCATDLSRLDSVANAIVQAGGEAAWGRCDVADPDSVAGWTQQMAQRLGGADLLINNAAVLGVRASMLETPLESWRRTIDVNVNGLFYVSQAALPYLMKSETPCAVHVTSSVGRQARAGWGAYSVSKFGVEAINQLIDAELGDRGVRSFCFNPGATATDMRAEAYPEEDPATLPTADRVAEILIEMIENPNRYPGGGSYDARSVMEL